MTPEMKKSLENIVVAMANEQPDVAKSEFSNYVQQKAREILSSENVNESWYVYDSSSGKVAEGPFDTEAEATNWMESRATPGDSEQFFVDTGDEVNEVFNIFKRRKDAAAPDLVRPPTDEEFTLVQAFMRRKGAVAGSIGVNKKTGQINIEDEDGNEYVIDGVARS